MNNRLEEIKKLLPDNDNGDITEKDMRDAFAMTFDEIGEKIDKPTGEGTTATHPYVFGLDRENNPVKLPAGDLGKNFSNTNLTFTEHRSHNLNGQNLSFTGGKVGFGVAVPTETVDVSGRVKADAVILNTNNTSAIANRVRTNGTFLYHANSSAIEKRLMYYEATEMTNLLKSMSDTQKEEWRKASLKTTEQYSLGQAVVEGFDFPLLDRSLNYTQYRSIIGINLFIDNTSNSSAQVKLIKRGSGEEYIINNFETFQTNPSILTFAITEGMLPVGIYDVKVLHNSVWSVINSAAALYVQDGIQSQSLPSLTWALKDKNGALPPAYENGGNSNGASGDAASLSARMKQTSDNYIAISQVPILTPEDMQRGVMLEFDVDISTDAIALTTFSMGITDNNTSNNSNLTVGFGKTSGAEISYAPSGVRKTLVSEGKGYSKLIRDKMIWLIKDGLITIYFKSQGRGATQPLDTSKNYYFKLVMSGNPMPDYYWSDVKVSLTSKKLI